MSDMNCNPDSVTPPGQRASLPRAASSLKDSQEQSYKEGIKSMAAVLGELVLLSDQTM